jgi:D-alanyl-D-alanine carboxypeptidase/D-alanyl-D-alanine-endopeptidase (penicillin-binding protein 4)
MPASTLKLVTAGAAIDTLGYDYEFSTKLYKSTNNDLYLQLAGDPFFTSSNLNNLFKTAKEKNIVEPKTVYIDDYIFDSTIWGEGWQWDDDLNVHMPKFSSYNIDGNILRIIINPTQPGSPAEIKTAKFYPVTFMNLVTTGTSDNVWIKRNNNISPDIINLEGTVSKQMLRHIPINNLKRYFKLRLDDAIRSAKIDYYGKYPQMKLPASNVYLVDETNHSILKVIQAVLKDSNNLAAESLFKAAGAKFVNNTGSLEHSQQMLNSYFNKIGINNSEIRIVDGSGVSKNNLVTAEFMTNFLVKIGHDELFVNTLPTPGEGTLKERMLYFKDNLRAKTGTLSDVSAIAGYITARSGKKYAFDIMINDPKSNSQEKKSLEEYILRDIYSNY